MYKDFFTADLHLGHTNIIEYCNRPFASSREMDNTIITRWNETVDDTDTVYVLGDFCFGNQEVTLDYLACLKGKIVLIRGNHDADRNVRAFAARGLKVWDSLVLPNGLAGSLNLKHRPLEDNHYEKPAELEGCSFYLHGHIHNLWVRKTVRDVKLINVGVDVWDFRPQTLYSLMADPTVF